MEDYSKEDWVDYIKSHLNEFDIQETGPDNYKLWHIDITSKINRNYSASYEDVNKETAENIAIERLAGDLFQYYRTPENIWQDESCQEVGEV